MQKIFEVNILCPPPASRPQGETIYNYLDTSVVTSDSETDGAAVSSDTQAAEIHTHSRLTSLHTYTAFLSSCLHFKEILQTQRAETFLVVHIYIPIIQRQTK